MRFTIIHRGQKPPVEHSQSASKSVWRPAHHVSITTYKVALPASSKYNLIVPKCGLDDQIMQKSYVKLCKNEGTICSKLRISDLFERQKIAYYRK